MSTVHLNDGNPINWPELARAEKLATINFVHPAMQQHIADAWPDSAAYRQVAAAQYAQAVSEARRALEKVLDLQERAMVQAWANRPNDEIDRLLIQAGL